ncbi:alpha-L-fucosidase [Ginsengibacter hankyongi]|uniref:Alpha-L-fucosidase n=1 Tax=Ginsengibacter hankyongi TaxID=2607284 RepID=A0A5J5IJP2_9BACT|nr:alpha-L-fucosidase [Ginsengibacter hankyongi]KAA9041196.1 alpha-L-fucosidase [Ginsengibacter hankyongi]
MKRTDFMLLVILLLSYANTFGQSNPATSVVKLNVNWKQFLSKQDLLWDTMPGDYFEGPFVGNGLLGTIIFKDDKDSNTLRFEIGRTDVYDHRTKEASAYETPRLPIGQLLLTPVGKIIKTHMRCDLWNAEIRGVLTTTAGIISFRCFVPSREELIVLTVKASGKEKNAKFTLRPQQAESPRYIFKKPIGGEKGGYDYQQNPSFRVEKMDGIEVVTQPLLKGDDYATAWSDQKNADGSQTVLVTVANRWGKYRKPASGSAIDAVATIKAGQEKAMATMEKAHRAWWHAFYPASFVTLPDTRLESFYWIQLYKLGSATHPGCPVIDLLGPWFKSTSWPLLWMNLNVQLTYYTLGITNHPDLEDNLYQLLERHKGQMIQNVPKEFQNDCAGIRNPVQYDDLYAPLFLTEDTAGKEAMNLIVLPWLMQEFYVHNRMTMDDNRLRNSVYPLLRRAFNVYMRILHKEGDGLYHIPYTYSDEYGNAKETSLNIALARWGFKTLISCASRLKIDDPLLHPWKEMLAKMQDYNVDDNGIMVGKDMPFAKPHRHYSHLFAIFPLYDMNIENDQERIPLMKKSIEHYTALDGDNCIYKFSGASSLWAASGEGDSSLKWLNRSLELLPRFGVPPAPKRIPTLTQNTFYSERENPTFESPISSSRSMLDMLIQSWGGTIRVFPACPSTWKNASFYNLRTEGAFLISAVRNDGKTKFIQVKSLAGEPCKIKLDLSANIKLIGPKTANMHLENGLIELTLKKGEEAIIYAGKKPESFEISPVPEKPGEMNSWGVH